MLSTKRNRLGALLLGLAMSLPAMSAFSDHTRSVALADGAAAAPRPIRTGSDVEPGHIPNNGIPCRRSATDTAADELPPSTTVCNLRLVKRQHGRSMVWV